MANDVDRLHTQIQSLVAAIKGLQGMRDWLGIQLDHAWNNMSDEDFDKEVDRIFATREQEMTHDVELMIRTLLLIPDVTLDTEILSEIFGVKISDVQAIVQNELNGDPTERRMFFERGFGDGAKGSALKYPENADYTTGWRAGQEAKGEAVSNFCQVYSIPKPDVLR